jgi:heme exporter protein C
MTDNRTRALLHFSLGGWVLLVILAAFFYAPSATGFKGESARIVFFHVPQAWVAVLAFCVNLVASIRYLRKRNPLDDARAAAAARLGLVFSVLATVTGSIFANVMWNSFWNWDPREVSIVILLLIYAAYFALREAIPDEERRASLSAAYAVLAFVTMPFLVFVEAETPDGIADAPDPVGLVSGIYWIVLLVVHSGCSVGAGTVGSQGA